MRHSISRESGEKRSAEQAVCAPPETNSAVGPSAPPITPTAQAEDEPSTASGLMGRSLSRVSEIRTGSAGSGSSAQRRSVKCAGKPRPNAVSGSVCSSSDSAVSVCSVPVYGCVKRNASPGARTVKRGPGSGAGVRRWESSIE